MADTQGLMPIVNGNTVIVQELVSIDNTGTNVAPQFVIRSDGTIVGQASPLPVADEALLVNQGSIVTALQGDLKTAAPPLTYTLSTSVSVGTSTGTLVAAGVVEKSLTITTQLNSAANVWLNPTGGSAVVGSGLVVYGGGGSLTFGSESLPLPVGPITAITDGTSARSVALAGG